MLIKRIILTLLITGVIATATQAQSISRKTWMRGNSINNAIPTVPDQEVERVPVTEMQITSQESKKTAIVGSWLLTVDAAGIRILLSLTSDGIAFASGQGDISLDPQFPTQTMQQGVWTHLAGRQFAINVVALQYDVSTAEYLGMGKVRPLLTLDETGDQFTGTVEAKFFDPDGNLVGSFSSTIHGVRIKI